MRAVLPILFLAYPILAYVGLTRFEPRAVAAVLGAALLARFAVQAKALPAWHGPQARRVLLPTLLAGAVIATAALTEDPRLFLAVPVLLSAALLISFGLSILRPPTFVEVIARAQAGTLSDEEVRYCRSVTAVWCLFFVVNGAIAATLALRGALAAWTLYCGLLSYLLMGLLFAGEVVYRAWRFRRYTGSPTDPLLRRLFPPREAL